MMAFQHGILTLNQRAEFWINTLAHIRNQKWGVDHDNFLLENINIFPNQAKQLIFAINVWQQNFQINLTVNPFS